MAIFGRDISRYSFGLMVMLGASWLGMIPVPAQAQVYPCPAGPGEGERMVGSSQAGQGIAAVPMCAADSRTNGSNSNGERRSSVIPPARYPKNLIPGWGMVVTFTDRNGKETGKNKRDAYVAVVNRSTSEEAFETTVRECLAKVMRGHEDECPREGGGFSATTLAYITVYRYPSGEYGYQITNAPNAGREIRPSACAQARDEVVSLKIASLAGIDCPIVIVDELTNGTPKKKLK